MVELVSRSVCHGGGGGECTNGCKGASAKKWLNNWFEHDFSERTNCFMADDALIILPRTALVIAALANAFDQPCRHWPAGVAAYTYIYICIYIPQENQ